MKPIETYLDKECPVCDRGPLKGLSGQYDGFVLCPSGHIVLYVESDYTEKPFDTGRDPGDENHP